MLLPRRSSIFSLVFLVVISGALVFLFQHMLAAQKAFREERVLLAGLETRARRADALEARFKGVESEAQTIGRAFLKREDLPSFFSTIESRATAAGVTETTSIAGETKDEMRFLLHARGSFDKLFIFVTHLNVLPTLLFVEEVSFSTGAIESQGSRSEEISGNPSVNVVIRVPLRTEAGEGTEASADETNEGGDLRQDEENLE